MRIAVLGAGSVGVPLAKAFAAAGHDVKLANSRGPETIRALADSIGVTAEWSADAVRDVDAIVTCVNPGNYEQVRLLLADVPTRVPVIDTGNYHPMRDGQIAAIEDFETEAHWISGQLGRPVTKAWSTVLSQTIAEGGMPAGSSERIAVAVAGDDPAARQVAAMLTNISGFDPVDIGGLDESWRVQPGTAAYCTELPIDAFRAAVECADAQNAAVRRDMGNEIIRTFGDVKREDIVRLYRAITRTLDPL